jgi:hypothetical protein
MQNEQILFFQTLDMGWVVSERMMRQIGAGNFSLRKLGEVSIKPEGRPGSDSGPGGDHDRP